MAQPLCPRSTACIGIPQELESAPEVAGLEIRIRDSTFPPYLPSEFLRSEIMCAAIVRSLPLNSPELIRFVSAVIISEAFMACPPLIYSPVETSFRTAQQYRRGFRPELDTDG